MAMMALLFNEEERAKGRSLKLRPTDIVIAPFGKSGTTWVQQIVHCLRTRGDMDFDDISRVVPWIETSAMLGLSTWMPSKKPIHAPSRAICPGMQSRKAVAT